MIRRRWAAALLASIGFLAACSEPGEQPLPVASAEWADRTHLWVYTGCAELTDVEVDRTKDKVELTLRGTPKDGDCEDYMVLKVEAGTRSFIDAATGELVELPPYVPSPTSGHG
ncbi:MAG: hypothetical protein U0P45_05785 [Acidimicrobiales bacterium]